VPAADHEVGSRSAVEPVVAVAAVELVVLGAAGEMIVAGIAVKDVHSREREGKLVVQRRAVEQVGVEREAGDAFVDRRAICAGPLQRGDQPADEIPLDDDKGPVCLGQRLGEVHVLERDGRRREGVGRSDYVVPSDRVGRHKFKVGVGRHSYPRGLAPCHIRQH